MRRCLPLHLLLYCMYTYKNVLNTHAQVPPSPPIVICVYLSLSIYCYRRLPLHLLLYCLPLRLLLYKNGSAVCNRSGSESFMPTRSIDHLLLCMYTYKNALNTHAQVACLALHLLLYCMYTYENALNTHAQVPPSPPIVVLYVYL
jgi:hypothetical protein